MNENDILLNKAFCIPIESEDAKCHPDLGDGRKTYPNNGYYIFKRNEQWYFVPEANEFGNSRTMTRLAYENLKTLFDIITTIEELANEPSEEV